MKHLNGEGIFINSCHFCCSFCHENGPLLFSDTELSQCYIQYIIFSGTCQYYNSPEKFIIFVMMHAFICRKNYPACCAELLMTMCIKNATVQFFLVSRDVNLIKSQFILFMSYDSIYFCIGIGLHELLI